MNRCCPGTLLIAIGALMVLGAAAPAGHEQASLTVVRDGKAGATIVVAPAASKEIRQSAELLVSYIKQSTGADVPITHRAAKGTIIHLGDTGFPKTWHLDANQLDPQEFTISFPDDGHLVILGGSDIGIHYGVLEFLERYVGVRWLFPGELGTYVPKRTELAVARTEVCEKPAYKMRLLSGRGFRQEGSDQWRWVYRLRMKALVDHHHNMYNLYRPSLFLKDHPEFYAVQNGKRVRPKSDSSKQQGWNPCWTAAGIVEAGVDRISETFKQYPEKTSFSLGINDVTARCRCPDCEAAYKTYGGTNSVYYRWATAIAEGVTRKFPHKKFGLLAYFEAMEPPKGTELHPAIVPFVTYERLRWADDRVKRDGHFLNQRWEKLTAEMGWYDYIYGSQHYSIPRAWYHVMAEYLRYGRDHGVPYYYAEAYPAERWSDGPKLYLALKLLWNPDLNVDRALDDWCTAAVGSKAAPSLRGYFDFWEEYWTRRLPKQKAYFSGGGIILPSIVYNSQAYMDLLTPDDLEKVQSLMVAVLSNSETEEQKRRAEFFNQSLEYSLKAVKDYKATERDSLLEKLASVHFPGTIRGSIVHTKQQGLDFGSDDFIVEAWCKPDAIDLHLLEKGRPGDSGTPGIQIGTAGVTLVVVLKGTTGDGVRIPSKFYFFDRPKRWVHLFLVFDRDGQLRFFRNTRLHGGGDISGVGSLETEAPFQLGCRGSKNRYYQGKLGPVRCYRFAGGELPPDAQLVEVIRYQYDHPDRVHELLEPALVARWEMDKRSPKLLNDRSGKGNHLTLSGDSPPQPTE